jgi:hypothetical protein
MSLLTLLRNITQRIIATVAINICQFSPKTCLKELFSQYNSFFDTHRVLGYKVRKYFGRFN